MNQIKLCSKCNIRPAELKNGRCKECQKEYNREYYKKKQAEIKKKNNDYYHNNKDTILPKQREASKEYYYANQEIVRDRHKTYFEKNKDKVHEINRQYYQENKDRLYTKHRNWFQENPGKSKEYIKLYRERNPHLNRSMAAKRRAQMIFATPLWANMEKIKSIYEQASLLEKHDGIKRHIDHIVPLRGKNVCGLHVHQNLQILTAEENLKKSNKF